MYTDLVMQMSETERGETSGFLPLRFVEIVGTTHRI
jgi:hypothetical protein